MITKRLRVVVADDHGLFRRGLCTLLQRHRSIQVVGEARDGEEAVLMVREMNPDVLLLDLDMPILDGISVTRILNRNGRRPKIIVLTSYEDETKVATAIS